MKWFVAAASLIALGACSTVETHSTPNRVIGTESFASVGDALVRVEVKEDLPNAFGRADLFGRKRDRGFSEIRYLGLDERGNPVFRRRDVDILTNETAVNRMGLGTAAVSLQPVGNGLFATGTSTRAAPPVIEALPADTIQFAMDLSQGRVITVRDQTIEIIEATASGVRFNLR